MDRLACLLSDAAERDEGPDGMDARLFLELTTRGVEEILTALDDALRDRPGAGVAILPERPAGVSDEQLESGIGPPEEQEAGAHVGSSRSSHTCRP